MGVKIRIAPSFAKNEARKKTKTKRKKQNFKGLTLKTFRPLNLASFKISPAKKSKKPKCSKLKQSMIKAIKVKELSQTMLKTSLISFKSTKFKAKQSKAATLETSQIFKPKGRQKSKIKVVTKRLVANIFSSIFL